MWELEKVSSFDKTVIVYYTLLPITLYINIGAEEDKENRTPPSSEGKVDPDWLRQQEEEREQRELQQAKSEESDEA